tara:strand:- start:535 stop:900 length:366 start_codon:yes stop_codon:yes gene_type:complete
MKIRASDSLLHPEGVFRGKIKAIEATNRYLEGVPEMVFVVETAPIGEDGPTGFIRHCLYCIPADTSRFSRMFHAVCGKEVTTDSELCTNELIGGQATVVVQHYTKDNGRKGHRIKRWGTPQ